MSFIESHPQHQFTEADKMIDFSEKDRYYIRTLKSLEQLTDLDAYLVDYRKNEVVYLTKNCFLRRFIRESNITTRTPLNLNLYDKIVDPGDLQKMEAINLESFNFYYKLPIERRYHGSYTLDVRIKDGKGGYVMLNYKVSPLDITDDGRLRLGLCLLSYPATKLPGKGYFKMTDTSTVYEYFENVGKFIEVKSHRITSKSEAVLELASKGKTEVEISRLLNISVNTVKYHKRHIFKQLNVRNIAEAIQWKNSQKIIHRE